MQKKSSFSTSRPQSQYVPVNVSSVFRHGFSQKQAKVLESRWQRACMQVSRRGRSYPITSTALLSSASCCRDMAMGSHRLSLAMILTLSRPLLSRVYRSSWNSQSQSHSKEDREQRETRIHSWDNFISIWVYNICCNHVKNTMAKTFFGRWLTLKQHCVCLFVVGFFATAIYILNCN